MHLIFILKPYIFQGWIKALSKLDMICGYADDFIFHLESVMNYSRESKKRAAKVMFICGSFNIVGSYFCCIFLPEMALTEMTQ